MTHAAQHTDLTRSHDVSSWSSLVRKVILREMNDPCVLNTGNAEWAAEPTVPWPAAVLASAEERRKVFSALVHAVRDYA